MRVRAKIDIQNPLNIRPEKSAVSLDKRAYTTLHISNRIDLTLDTLYVHALDKRKVSSVN